MFFTTKNWVKLLLLLIILVGCIALFDQPIYNWLLHAPPISVRLGHTWNHLGEGSIWFGALALSYGYIYFKRYIVSDQTAYHDSVAKLNICLAALVSSGLICDGFKYLLGRARPFMLVQHISGFFPFHHGAAFRSMPSGHATVAATVATLASIYFPKLSSYWGVLFVISIALGRMLVQDHFLSDVLAGAWLGWVTTNLVYQRLQKVK